jgi:single-strand DNA-binding protein
MAKVAQMNDDFEYLNEVSLIGRLSGVPIEKELPSGDKVVEFRLVVGRSKNSSGKSKVSVDTIEIAVWGARNRKIALRFNENSWIEVEGAIRRRFWHSPNGLASRWQVEASEIYAI